MNNRAAVAEGVARIEFADLVEPLAARCAELEQEIAEKSERLDRSLVSGNAMSAFLATTTREVDVAQKLAEKWSEHQSPPLTRRPVYASTTSRAWQKVAELEAEADERETKIATLLLRDISALEQKVAGLEEANSRLVDAHAYKRLMRTVELEREDTEQALCELSEWKKRCAELEKEEQAGTEWVARVRDALWGAFGKTWKDGSAQEALDYAQNQIPNLRERCAELEGLLRAVEFSGQYRGNCVVGDFKFCLFCGAHKDRGGKYRHNYGCEFHAALGKEASDE